MKCKCGSILLGRRAGGQPQTHFKSIRSTPTSERAGWSVIERGGQNYTYKDEEIEDKHEVLDAAEAVPLHGRPPR